MSELSKAFVLVFLLTFLFLLPYWTIQGIFWDGWIYHSTLIFDNSDALFVEFRNNGRIYSAYLINLLSGFTNPSWVGLLISCASIALSAAIFFAIVDRIGVFSRNFSILCALLGGAFPAYQVFLSLSALNFFVILPLFYMAVYLALLSHDAPPGRSFKLKLVASALFLLSFTGEATILFCWWTFFLSGLYFKKRGLTVYEAALNSLKANFWIFPLSFFGFYLLMFQFSPMAQSGYKESRAINFDNLGNLVDYISVIVTWNINAFLLLIIGYGIKFYFESRQTKNEIEKQGEDHFTPSAICVSIIGILLAIGPFLIAGREPNVQGWETRYLMYTAFPLSLFLVSLIVPVGAVNILNGNRKLPRYLLAIIFLCLSHVGVSWLHALDWQLRWTRDSAVSTYLALETKPKVGLIIFDDQGGGTAENYRLYELVGLVKTALGRPTVTATQGTRVSGLPTSVNVQDHLLFDSKYFDPINRNRNHHFGNQCQKIKVDDGHLATITNSQKVGLIYQSWQSSHRSMFKELALSVFNC